MLSDLRFAFRQLARSPGFTSVAVLTLTLGIGFSVSSFSFANAFLLRDLPYPNAPQLVRIFRTSPQSDALKHAPANLADIRAAATSFSGTAIFNGDGFTLGEPGQPAERVLVLHASAEFFDVLGLPPLLGRGFVRGDDQPDHPLVTVIPYRTWQQRYGGDPAVVGRTVRLNTLPFTIVGVLPPEFDAPLVWDRPEFIVSLRFSPSWLSSRTSHAAHCQCVARLKPGVSLRQARSELSVIADRLSRAFPEENTGMGLRVAPLHDSNQTASNRQLMWLMSALALTILLIACANLAALQTARAFGRLHDYGIRAALGGSRGQLMKPLVYESVLLALASGLAGLLLAVWINDLVSRSVWIYGERGFPLPIDGRVIAFAMLIALLSGLAFGLAPAWLAAHGSAAEALKDASHHATASRGQQRLKRALIAGTLALALALIGAAASFGLGCHGFLERPLGWDPHGLFVGSVFLPPSRYESPEKTKRFHDALLSQVTALPEVDHAALAPTIPFTSLEAMNRPAPVIVEGQPVPPPGREILVEATNVSAGFFATLRIPLLQGELFSPHLQRSDPLIAIVNDSFARQVWPGQNPLGRRVRLLGGATISSGEAWLQIVGVVGDVGMLSRVDTPATRLQLYRPLAQIPTRYHMLILRTKGAPDAVAPSVRKIIASLDPELALGGGVSLDAWTGRARDNFNLVVHNLATSAGLGLLIAAVGLFGVVAQLTSQRTREIGVRMALGANATDVVRMILSEGAKFLLAGIAAGVPAFYVARFLVHRSVPEVALPGPWLLFATLAILAFATLAACWLPARRASHIDPVNALRAE